jgi:uncharacterized protein (DUF2267 family)
MTPKEKYNDIDLSKLPEKAVEQMNRVKPFLFDREYQKPEYAESVKEAEEGMDKLYATFLQRFPESVKSKVAKQPKPKTPQAMAKQAAQATIIQPKKGKSTASAGATKRGNVIALAKEIRKEGESWTDARRRAGQMIQQQKTVAVKKANKQYEKLKAFLEKNPIFRNTNVASGSKKAGTYQTKPLDIERDAARRAKPSGKRVSKDGNTYYEYRENRIDRFTKRKRYPYLELGGKLHGAGMFSGGGMANKSKQQIVDAVLEQMKRNVSEGDITVEEELFMMLPKDKLVHALREEDWHKYQNAEKEQVVDAVLEQMKRSVSEGDITVEEELFMMLPKKALLNSLGEYAESGKLHGAGMFADGGKLKTPTNQEVWNNGEIIENWASDVGGSNESTDNIVEYNGVNYLVITDAHEGVPLYPKSKADIWDETYAKGGGVGSKKDKAMKKVEKHIKYAWRNTDMGSGWEFWLDGFDLEMLYIDFFDGADIHEDWNNLSKSDKDYYFKEWKEDLWQSSYEQFKQLAFEKYSYFFMASGGNISNEDKYSKGGGVGNKKVITDQRGNTFYLTKIDHTHFFLSIDENDKGEPYHIGQIKNQPYYKEVEAWLNGENYAGGGIIPNQRTDIKFNDYLATAYTEGFEEAPSYDAVIEAWTYLIATKLAYQMQGWFGRTANQLIEQGAIAKDGTINWDMVDNYSDEYAKGGKFGGGGGTDDFVNPNILYAKLGEAEMNFEKDNGAEYNRVRQELEDNAAKYYAALNNAEMNFQQDNGAEYNRLIEMRYLFAKGGKTSKKKPLSERFNYIPNYMIQEVEVERKGKTTFIDAANILDGVYVKKGVKYAHGGEISHLAPKYKTHRNNEK